MTDEAQSANQTSRKVRHCELRLQRCISLTITSVTRHPRLRRTHHRPPHSPDPSAEPFATARILPIFGGESMPKIGNREVSGLVSSYLTDGKRGMEKPSQRNVSATAFMRKNSCS